MNAWLSSASHTRWLEEEAASLLSFGTASLTEHGFGWLTREGAILETKDLELWINCRMTHCFALGSLLGRPECGPLADHGVSALSTAFHDAEHGGYFAAVGHDGRPTDDSKQAYAHAFVVLAASSAVEAGRPGAEALLEQALEALETHFFEPEHGMHAEKFSRDFSESEQYRGINANMHCVEGLLAAASATERADLLDRAVVIIERALGFAKAQNWMLPEHFSTAWEPNLEFNADSPADPFRPYGATIGHWFEWGRLALHAYAGLKARGDEAPESLHTDALALLEAGAATWAMDGTPGFVYTVDWEGKPVVSERMHWVAAEAVGAAAVAYQLTGDPVWEERYQLWWEYIAEHMIDREGGSWFHELSASNEPSSLVWPDKPDVYHALQATLIPRLPAWPPLAGALASDALDAVQGAIE